MFESSEWLYVYEQSSLGFFLWFIPLFLMIYFIPTLLAVFFNRQHLGKIALANIPAGLSMIAWFALIGVACSGKLLTKKTKLNNTIIAKQMEKTHE